MEDLIEKTETEGGKLFVCRCCLSMYAVLPEDNKQFICLGCQADRKISQVSFPAYEITSKPYSKHPDDHYLRIVMATIKDKEYATWLYNKELDGMYEGHYFTTRREAMIDYAKRGIRTVAPGEIEVVIEVTVQAETTSEAIRKVKEAVNELDTSVSILAIGVNKDA